jgi:pentatricopeptide repeat protein
MKAEGLQQNPVTFVRVLNACASVGALEEGRHAHKQLIQSGCKSDVFVDHSLIDKYAKCGSMEDASRVFNKMTTCDMLSWSAMLFGLLKSGSSTKTHWNYFEKCNRKGCTSPPSHLGGVLNACANVGALEESRYAHKQIIESSCESDVFVRNSLVDMYAKCGSMEDAGKVFNKMPLRNVVSWTDDIGTCEVWARAEGIGTILRT